MHRLPYTAGRVYIRGCIPAHAESLESLCNGCGRDNKYVKSTKPYEWLIVDHYALDSRWEVQMRPFVKKIMVIDDLADRRHDCDVLLDQNLFENMETRYDDLVPWHCRKLLARRIRLASTGVS